MLANGLKAGRMVWKLAEWFTSSLNDTKAVQVGRTNSPVALTTEKVVKLFTEACASETVQPMPAQIGY